MKNYEVTRVQGTPDWDKIPVAPMDQYLWSDVRSIQSSAQLAWDEETLYVRLQAIEPHILARFTGHLDSVCCDSCLEFFFCPMDCDRYFNFEANPNGAMYVGYGRPGSARCRLYREDYKELLQVKTFTIPGGWGLEMQIPRSFIQIYVPEFTLCAGKELRGNFYKCGDETQQQHFMAWNPVDMPYPCFHAPEFFGNLKLA